MTHDITGGSAISPLLYNNDSSFTGELVDLNNYSAYTNYPVPTTIPNGRESREYAVPGSSIGSAYNYPDDISMGPGETFIYINM